MRWYLDSAPLSVWGHILLCFSDREKPSRGWKLCWVGKTAIRVWESWGCGVNQIGCQRRRELLSAREQEVSVVKDTKLCKQGENPRSRAKNKYQGTVNWIIPRTQSVWRTPWDLINENMCSKDPYGFPLVVGLRCPQNRFFSWPILPNLTKKPKNES